MMRQKLITGLLDPQWGLTSSGSTWSPWCWPSASVSASHLGTHTLAPPWRLRLGQSVLGLTRAGAGGQSSFWLHAEAHNPSLLGRSPY